MKRIHSEEVNRHNSRSAGLIAIRVALFERLNAAPDFIADRRAATRLVARMSVRLYPAL